ARDDGRSSTPTTRPGVSAMQPIVRRNFLRTVATTAASAMLASQSTASSADGTSPKRWKKAFMLGNLNEGSPLGPFRLLKEAGFEGVELSSPNRPDPP